MILALLGPWRGASGELAGFAFVDGFSDDIADHDAAIAQLASHGIDAHAFDPSSEESFESAAALVQAPARPAPAVNAGSTPPLPEMAQDGVAEQDGAAPSTEDIA